MSDEIVRPDPTPADFRKDVWLGVGLFVIGVISSGLMTVVQLYGEQQAGIEWALLTTAIACFALAFRRRVPITVAFVVSAIYFVAATFKVPEMHVGNIAMFIAIFTVGAWVNDRRRAFWGRIIIVSLMMVWLLVTMYIEATAPLETGLSRVGVFSPYAAFMLLNLLINVAFFGGAYYMGDRAYRSALEAERLRQRTREVETERERTAAQAVALDRIGIARELHDVVAHHVSAMGVQAAAARLMLDKKPEATALALGEIERSARTAIDELHHLLETLRAPGDTAQPVEASTLTLDRLPELITRVTEVGMPTTFAVIGQPCEVPQVVHANLYRIAQEALTNARRHGGPDATADVRLRYTGDNVELEVTNTGRAPLKARPGLGQLGMRERATASGGTIELGPTSSGGFLVRATIPLPGSHRVGARDLTSSLLGGNA